MSPISNCQYQTLTPIANMTYLPASLWFPQNNMFVSILRMTQIPSNLVPHNSIFEMSVFNHVCTNACGLMFSSHIQGYNQLGNASNVNSGLKVT